MHQKNQLRSGIEKLPRIRNDNWYIVLIKKNQADILQIRAFIKFIFPNPKTADMFLKNTPELKHLFLIKLSGKKILEYNIKVLNSTRKLAGIRISTIDKYKYPPERITFQNKKSFRTTLRRQMRDYGKRINDKFY